MIDVSTRIYLIVTPEANDSTASYEDDTLQEVLAINTEI